MIGFIRTTNGDPCRENQIELADAIKSAETPAARAFYEACGSLNREKKSASWKVRPCLRGCGRTVRGTAGNRICVQCARMKPI